MTLDTYPRVGQILEGKYAVERQLGEGSMGAVFQATHQLHKAPVALKFLAPQLVRRAGAVERFLNEGVAVARIDSNHVVKVHDVNKLPNGTPYLVMEYLPGQDLKTLLDREPQRRFNSVPRAIHFALQILRGLQVAHRAGIIHRDMKPANVLVSDREDAADYVKIVDFGISKVATSDQDLTRAHATMGTPLYMSLEQARSSRDVDARSDVYAVAVILYEMLTGQTPFGGPSLVMSQVLVKIATEDPPPIAQFRTDVPPALAQVIRKSLSKIPDERAQSAGGLAAELAPYADSRSTTVLQRLIGQLPSIRVGPAFVVPPQSLPQRSQQALSVPSQAAGPSARAPLGTLSAVSHSVRMAREPETKATTESEASGGISLRWIATACVGLFTLGIVLALSGLGDSNGTEPTSDTNAATDNPPTNHPTGKATQGPTEAPSPREAADSGGGSGPNTLAKTSSTTETGTSAPAIRPKSPPKAPASARNPRLGATPKTLGGISIED